MQLTVERHIQGYWLVTGEGVEAIVYGNIVYGPNGAIQGKGARKYRAEILNAVDAYRREVSERWE